ncbi:MAG: hypothetical protein WCA49_04610 [Candidatus Sulfotelmatobacter sp.]
MPKFLNITPQEIERLKRESKILDQGYDAVRLMAKEMIQNGATLSDILFHANQVWHEFKVGAAQAGLDEVVNTGMHLVEYSPGATNKIILSDERYAGGRDVVRAAQLASKAGAKAAGK